MNQQSVEIKGRSDRRLDRGIERQYAPLSQFSDAGKDFQRDFWMI
jgi:hypothetical protein